VRAVMVAEVDRTWLDMIVDQLPRGEDPLLHDPGRLAPGMSMEQRTGLRALLVALSASSRVEPGSLRLWIREDGPSARVDLYAVLRQMDGSARAEFGPFLAVMRTVFPDLKVEMSAAAVTVRFSYGR
jgi:hypothetical protein